MQNQIKLIVHGDGKCVVNQPGSGKSPLVYHSLERALTKVRELAQDAVLAMNP